MKTILSAIFTVALVSVLVGAGTFAYYADTEMSGDNTFTSGTMDLYLTNTILSPDAQWIIANGAPGESLSSHGDIKIFNLGSIEADHVEIDFSLTGYEDDNGNLDDGVTVGPEPEPESDPVYGVGAMAKSLRVISMTSSVVDYNPLTQTASSTTTTLVDVDSVIIDSRITDVNGNGWVDLDDLAQTTLDGLQAPEAINLDAPDYLNYCQLDMRVYLMDTGVPQNEFQGDIIDMTITVTLNQDESQTEP